MAWISYLGQSPSLVAQDLFSGDGFAERAATHNPRLPYGEARYAVLLGNVPYSSKVQMAARSLLTCAILRTRTCMAECWTERRARTRTREVSQSLIAAREHNNRTPEVRRLRGIHRTTHWTMRYIENILLSSFGLVLKNKPDGACGPHQADNIGLRFSTFSCLDPTRSWSRQSTRARPRRSAATP